MSGKFINDKRLIFWLRGPDCCAQLRRILIGNGSGPALAGAGCCRIRTSPELRTYAMAL